MLRSRFVAFALLVRPQEDVLACTAVGFDGGATQDGSAVAGGNADCQNCDPRLAWIAPRENITEAERPVYVINGFAPRWVGYGRGKFYEPVGDQRPTPELGRVPQVRSTYGYWEAVLPLMNDQGLSMGESSCAANLVNFPLGSQKEDAKGALKGIANGVGALLDLTTLMQIAMERCATARCAVELMGRLGEDYGFFPMTGEWNPGVIFERGVKVGSYDDVGEALTVADTTGEAWVFHITGGVPGRAAKSVFVAQRIPKGQAAVIANNFIIREVPEKPTDDFIFSADLRGTAQAAGIWSPKDGPLDYSRVFAPDTVTFQDALAEAPIPMYASIRQWRILDLLAPTKGYKMLLDPLDLPSFVATERKVDHSDVQALLGDLYEGTEVDLTKGILAGPFGSPARAEGGPAMAIGQIPRGISIQRCVYSVVGLPRQDSSSSMFWFGVDTASTTVYVPLYPAAGDSIAEPYQTGTNKKFSRDSAWWAFDFVNNWMQLSYYNMSSTYVYPLRKKLAAEIESSRLALEATRPNAQALGAFQKKVQAATVKRWWELADFLIMTYNDNFYNTADKAGLNIGYPREYAEMIGFNQDIHPIYVKRIPPPVVNSYPMPSVWDFNSHSWSWAGPLATQAAFGQQLLALRTSGAQVVSSAVLTSCLAVLLGMSAAFAAGRRWERSCARQEVESSVGFHQF